jgi:glycosyltransferase involved in cell wall biosynthesis
MLKGRSVVGIDDVMHPGRVWEVPAGLSGTKGFKWLESGVRRLQRVLRLPYFAFFDLYRFYEACHRCLPDFSLCHDHNGLFCAGAAIACSRLNIPYVLTVSADPFLEREYLKGPLRGLNRLVAAWEARFTYRVAKKIICVSEPAKQHLVESWQIDPEKIEVMPNGVDINFFKPVDVSASTRAGFSIGNGPVICFVGAFHPWHGLDLLVESFARVLKEFPEAKLLLVGDGRARPALDQKIAEQGVGSSVIITGLVPQVQVPTMLALADVAVLPYPQLPKELWFSPLKLYEYMAAGKAIVASRAGQIAEVLHHGYTGLLTEPGNVNGLSQAILDLLNNPKLRSELGQNARRQAVEQHSWERYIQRLEKIYASVL